MVDLRAELDIEADLKDEAIDKEMEKEVDWKARNGRGSISFHLVSALSSLIGELKTKWN